MKILKDYLSKYMMCSDTNKIQVIQWRRNCTTKFSDRNVMKLENDKNKRAIWKCKQYPYVIQRESGKEITNDWKI